MGTRRIENEINHHAGIRVSSIPLLNLTKDFATLALFQGENRDADNHATIRFAEL